MTGAMLLCGLQDPELIHLAVSAGIGTIVLDGEHGFPLGAEVRAATIACHGAGGRCLVRLGPSQWAVAGTICDAGGDGVIASNVETIADVENLCRAMLPPPVGRRSINPFTAAAPELGSVTSFRRHAENLALWTMAETRNFVAALQSASKEDCATNLLSLWKGVVIGPYDLSAAFGQECDPANPELLQIVTLVRDLVHRLGLSLALFSRNSSILRAWVKAGIVPDYVVVGYDRDVWLEACQQRLEAVRTLT